MAHAEKCPICDGNGKIVPVNDGTLTAGPMDGICHGCGGKGWVEIQGIVPLPLFLLKGPHPCELDEQYCTLYPWMTSPPRW